MITATEKQAVPSLIGLPRGSLVAKLCSGTLKIFIHYYHHFMNLDLALNQCSLGPRYEKFELQVLRPFHSYTMFIFQIIALNYEIKLNYPPKQGL